MIDWLLNEYKAFFGTTRSGLLCFDQELQAGEYVYYDSNACNECLNRQIDICDGERSVFKFCSDRTLVKVDIENFFNQFGTTLRASITSRCDLMFFEKDNKITFCDMACYNPRYVEPFLRNDGSYQCGKRAKVYEQIKETIKKLIQVPAIQDKINSCPTKDSVFALRQKSATTNTPDIAMQNMLRLFPRYYQDTHLSTQMGYGFTFRTILYPEVYRW